MDHEATGRLVREVAKGAKYEGREASPCRVSWNSCAVGPRVVSFDCLRGFMVQIPLIFAILTLAFLAACSAGPTRTPAPTRLRITGSTTMTPALQELAAAFQAANPNVLVEVEGGDTANGWEDLRAGRADVAAVSWWDEGKPAPDGYRLAPVARDAVAVIVHPTNPISGVTALQLRALFAGEILDWAGLGGEEGEPAVVSREDGSGTRAGFEARIMGDRRVTLNALVMPTTAAVVDYVAGHRLAVGYSSAGAADKRVRIVPVESLLPEKQTAATNAYHLTRVLYLAAREPLSSKAKAFLDFAEGASARTVWNKHFSSIR